MDDKDAAPTKLILDALVALVREDWPSQLPLAEIAMRGNCSDEQIEALRSLEAGELPFGLS